jgi:hypothetical protein
MRPSFSNRGERTFPIHHPSTISTETDWLTLGGRLGFIGSLLLLIGSYWFPAEWWPFVLTTEGGLLITILACYRVAGRRAAGQLTTERSRRIH